MTTFVAHSFQLISSLCSVCSYPGRSLGYILNISLTTVWPHLEKAGHLHGTALRKRRSAARHRLTVPIQAFVLNLALFLLSKPRHNAAACSLLNSIQVAGSLNMRAGQSWASHENQVNDLPLWLLGN